MNDIKLLLSTTEIRDLKEYGTLASSLTQQERKYPVGTTFSVAKSGIACELQQDKSLKLITMSRFAN